MPRIKLGAPLLLAMSFLSMVSCTQSDPAPLLTDHKTEGNLESKNAIGCIAVSDVEDTYTPADLYKGVGACIAAGDYKNGSSLYAMAGIYGRFDTLRVTDRSAHQALTVLQMHELGSLPQGRMDKLRQEVTSIVNDDARLAELCARIRMIGPPSYAPRYMTQHGMGAFSSGGGSEPDEPFDRAAAWEKSLTSYLHCPAE